MSDIKQGATFLAETDISQGVLALIEAALDKNCFDAILIPAKVPASDSFAHVLIEDKARLKDAYPLCPIMTIQGARVISSLTARGEGKKLIAALIRPCEARATIELLKLGQVNLDNVILISMDCPGSLPLANWAKDPAKTEVAFGKVLNGEASESLRPVCQICNRFSATGGEDLHIGTIGMKGKLMLIPNSDKGKGILNKLGLKIETDVSEWQNQVDKATADRRKKREKAYQKLESESKGLDNLLATFSKCINCHNCMRVCPICYCRQCFFDSDTSKFPFEDYLARAETAGGLRLPPETLLFHIGRMLHMSLSCVSCGACEDACPTSIPVAQVFSLVGSRNQKEFDYAPGKNLDECLPLRVFQEEEFEEVEQSHAGISAKQETQDA
ncbi:4Fe-4S dicluster domain-containing protein [Chloroflexota bacterium]